MQGRHAYDRGAKAGTSGVKPSIEAVESGAKLSTSSAKPPPSPTPKRSRGNKKSTAEDKDTIIAHDYIIIFCHHPKGQSTI